MTQQKTCGQCEYFDAEYGDCLNPYSDRFQTLAGKLACDVFYPDTTPDAGKREDGDHVLG